MAINPEGLKKKQSSKKTTKNKDKPLSNRRLGVPTFRDTKVLKYWRFRQMGHTKVESVRLAGYSSKSSPGKIEGTQAYKAIEREAKELNEDMSTQIKRTIKRSGVTAGYLVEAHAEIVEASETDARDRINSLKELKSITGQMMPEKSEVSINGDEDVLKKLRGE